RGGGAGGALTLAPHRDDVLVGGHRSTERREDRVEGVVGDILQRAVPPPVPGADAEVAGEISQRGGIWGHAAIVTARTWPRTHGSAGCAPRAGTPPQRSATSGPGRQPHAVAPLVEVEHLTGPRSEEHTSELQSRFEL